MKYYWFSTFDTLLKEISAQKAKAIDGYRDMMLEKPRYAE